MSNGREREGVSAGVRQSDFHPIDEVLAKAYLLGYEDGRNGVVDRDATRLILEGRAAAGVIGAEGDGGDGFVG